MNGSATDENWQDLLRGKYLSLATRRRSGEFVATPVWFAPLAGDIVVFSAGNAGKVKRLRNFSESRVAPCTYNGTLKGPWLDTEAFLLDSAENKARALQALREKYGWLMKSGDVLASLMGRKRKRAYIRIRRKT